MRRRIFSTRQAYSIKHAWMNLTCYMLSPVRPSLRLSDCHMVVSYKTVEVMIMKFTPCGSPVSLVFAGKFHPEILIPPPSESVKQGENKPFLA